MGKIMKLFFKILALVIGGFFVPHITIIILLVMIFSHRHKVGINRLIESGQQLNCEVSEIFCETSNKRGRRYYIMCKYTDPYGALHFFKSEAIYQNPKGYLISEMVPVVVDPNNYKKFYVMLSEVLPEKFSYGNGKMRIRLN